MDEASSARLRTLIEIARRYNLDIDYVSDADLAHLHSMLLKTGQETGQTISGAPG